MQRHLPVGAEPTATGTHFRVWALGRRAIAVVAHGADHALTAEGDGYFSGLVPGIRTGDAYRLRIDGGAELFADPASRWQPDGAQGASIVCEDAGFGWTDADWKGLPRYGQVLYELHIGTFTQAGTWAAATERLQTLADLGITALQLMPIGEFGGAFGWGYDTLLHYAPSHHYGTPDQVRQFVDTAHRLGLGVILDVVYNHVGMGDHFRDFSDHYFTQKHKNEWGAGFNFDEEGAVGVREFVVQNAVHWIRDYHFDGLRLDATQALFDDSDEHIIAEIARASRAAAGNRAIYIVAENQPQDRRLLDTPEDGGYGLDALANDDFHHSARVALTGHNDFYYRDYLGTPQELVSSAKYSFLYHGQRSDMREAPYGTDNLATEAFRIVNFLENHDQIANSARGWRLGELGSAARVRTLTALLLLAPQTPCLFQGQEFGASGPFYYFAGYHGNDAEAVRSGRLQSLSNFPSVLDPAMAALLADPADPHTFAASKLDWAEYETHAHVVALHRDLLALRKSEAAFEAGTRVRVDGAVLADNAFVLRYFGPERVDDRLVLINLGRDHPNGVLAEPLMGPPKGCKWAVMWSSEDPKYHGAGQRPIDTEAFWMLPGDTALVLQPVPR